MEYRDLPTRTKLPGVPIKQMVITALVVVLGLGFLSSNLHLLDGSKAAEERLAQKKERVNVLKEQLKIYDDKLSEFEERQQAAADLEVLQIQLQQVRGVNEASRKDITEEKKKTVQLQELLAAYITRYRQQVRESAAGTKLDKLTTLEGTSYEDVTIKSVGALGMNITHRQGSCRIPFKQLPLEMQERYQFDEDEARNKLKREAERRRQYNFAIAAAEKAREEEKGESASRRDRMQEESRLKAIEKLKQAIKSLDSQIGAAQGMMIQERKKKLSRAPQYRVKIEALTKTKREYQARLRRLQAAAGK